MKKSLWGYRGDKDVAFLKVICSIPKMVPKVRGMFEEGKFDYKDLFSFTTTFESNILYVLRFMIDTKVGFAEFKDHQVNEGLTISNHRLSV